jgi:hypothetical protein
MGNKKKKLYELIVPGSDVEVYKSIAKEITMIEQAVLEI